MKEARGRSSNSSGFTEWCLINKVIWFSKGLVKRGVKLLSTGGTAKLLAQNGLPVIEVCFDHTRIPERINRRLKTSTGTRPTPELMLGPQEPYATRNPPASPSTPPG